MERGRRIVLISVSIVALAVILIGFFAVSRGKFSTSEVKSLTEADAVLAGIRYGSSPGYVREIMGEPDRITTSTRVEWSYEDKGLSITFSEQRAVRVYVTKGKTPRGLKIGDLLSRAKRLYGEPDQAAQYLYYWVSDDLDMVMVIHTDVQKRVRDIALTSQHDYLADQTGVTSPVPDATSEKNPDDLGLTAPKSSDPVAKNDEDFAKSILLDYELPLSIEVVLYHGGSPFPEQRRIKFTDDAWNSPAFQYLLRHKDWWREPRFVSADTLKVDEGRERISGTLRFNLVSASSVLDKPALLEFEASKTRESWVFSRFGKLRIEKSTMFDGRSIEEWPDFQAYDVSITVGEGRLTKEEMSSREFVWYVMSRDEIDNYGLGMGMRLAGALKGSQGYSGFFLQEAESSESWQYLYDHKAWWKDPVFLGVDNLEVIGREKITGMLRFNLYKGLDWDKPAYLDFELTRTQDGWIYTRFGKLTIRKSGYPKSDPKEDVEITVTGE